MCHQQSQLASQVGLEHRSLVKTLCREPHLPSQQRTIHGHIHIPQFPISAQNSEQVARAGYRGGSVTEQPPSHRST
ncbi:hypothetical protein FIBSPDRAFT_859534 [Athelia psychrophila]|uniref:Uncharacterized protein n=1 Tax=Athelia psychrophila TaxID=1759441 RepID=A0A166L1C9_9AGAM|nr:hypothetical protein FIBSPDRAFT_859534 [Fibularhizoctonia sp. CBS 109695]